MEITKKEHLEALCIAVDNIVYCIDTQDNRCTAEPIFLVQEQKRIYGMDPEYSGQDTVWLDCLNDSEELTDAEAQVLEERYLETLEEPENFVRTGYIDQWEYVQPFFTEEAAQNYIDMNKHRHDELRIYVDSAYRNYEWQMIRALLLSMKKS